MLHRVCECVRRTVIRASLSDNAENLCFRVQTDTTRVLLTLLLFMFCASAGLHALRRVLGSSPALSDVQVMSRVKVTTSDLRLAMTEVKPSAMREVAIDVPKVPCSSKDESLYI